MLFDLFEDRRQLAHLSLESANTGHSPLSGDRREMHRPPSAPVITGVAHILGDSRRAGNGRFLCRADRDQPPTDRADDLSHECRRVVHVAVTEQPTGECTAQQLRELSRGTAPMISLRIAITRSMPGQTRRQRWISRECSRRRAHPARRVRRPMVASWRSRGSAGFIHRIAGQRFGCFAWSVPCCAAVLVPCDDRDVLRSASSSALSTPSVAIGSPGVSCFSSICSLTDGLALGMPMFVM